MVQLYYIQSYSHIVIQSYNYFGIAILYIQLYSIRYGKLRNRFIQYSYSKIAHVDVGYHKIRTPVSNSLYDYMIIYYSISMVLTIYGQYYYSRKTALVQLQHLVNYSDTLTYSKRYLVERLNFKMVTSCDVSPRRCWNFDLQNSLQNAGFQLQNMRKLRSVFIHSSSRHV